MTCDNYPLFQVPENFKEVYILSGYRSPRSSPWQCLASVFAATNETLNFWTHFLPAIYFWWQMQTALSAISSDPEYAFPMCVFMVSICIFPIMSAVAHIFNTMSDRSRHICFFLDYAALGLYVVGSGIGYRAYMFPKFFMNTWYSDVYLYLSLALGVVSLVVACESRFLPQGPRKKAMRMLGFAVPYFFISFPLMCRILLCEAPECSWSALFYLKRHFTFAFISAVLFATHVPERLYPGRFDIIGHSHQLFHLCSVMGTNDQMNALYEDMTSRRELILARDTLPSLDFLLTQVAIFIALNVFVLTFFIVKIYRIVPADDLIRQRYRKLLSAQNNNNAKAAVGSVRQRKATDARGDA